MVLATKGDLKNSKQPESMSGSNLSSGSSRGVDGINSKRMRAKSDYLSSPAPYCFFIVSVVSKAR